MADDVTSNPGAGGSKFRSREDTSTSPSRHWPGAIIGWGGTAPGAPNEIDDVDGKRLPVKSVAAPVSSGGLSNDHFVTAASANASVSKNSPGQVYEINIFNNADYPIFLKLHNTATTPAAGVGVVYTLGVQAGTPGRVSFHGGLAFSAGIARTVVRGIADNDTTVVALNDASIDISFK